MTNSRNRKPAHHRPKDILVLALRNLWVGEELLCTAKSYEANKGRIDRFRQSRSSDMRIEIIPNGVIRKIRRVA